MQDPAPRPSIPAAWIVAGIACAAALVSITWLIAGRDNRQDNPGMQQLMSRLDALEARSEASRLRPRGSMPDGMTSAMPGGGVPGPNGALAGLGGQMLSPQEAEAQNQARLRQFESRFSQEPSDPAAAKVEDDMLVGMTDDQLAGAEIVPRDPDVKCRRDTCRITANFRSSSDASDWAVLYVTLMGSNYVTSSQPVFVKAADGSTQMRLFASRKAPAGAR
jgi:hypothetical protein